MEVTVVTKVEKRFLRIHFYRDFGRDILVYKKFKKASIAKLYRDNLLRDLNKKSRIVSSHRDAHFTRYLNIKYKLNLPNSVYNCYCEAVLHNSKQEEELRRMDHILFYERIENDKSIINVV